MFDPVESNVSLPRQEVKLVQFWKERGIYEKTLAARSQSPAFVFFEGPPTANGLPHPGHCLTRSIKDLFPRYKTMRGYRCQRKAGWDTHGLPVEVEVCKELGIHSKEQIETFGVEPFIHRCIDSVFRYVKQWEELTERIGFWIRLDEAYVTYHQSYVESVWWALKSLFERGLLYEGHKIVWWWAQGGTALSSGEVGQGYREVADPSVFVRFPLVDRDGVDLLVWTTTPWTLPSNQFAAVKPDLEYAVVSFADEPRKLIIASALVEAIGKKVGKELQIESNMRGAELIGLRYKPPFDYYYKADGERQGALKSGGTQHIAWRVVAADFVTVDTGSGLVHEAPAFGEVDFDLLVAEQDRFVAGQGPALINAVSPDGKFTADVPEFQGRWVKEADRDIIRNLKSRELLFHQEQYLHEYPFCWRADEDPLIQYPRKSWFIRTRQFREQMLANNHKINWLPEHIRDGRFGNFLESNVDWALSRERFWGTPLPIWVCEETGYMEAVSSYDELRQKPGASGFEVWEKAKAAQPGLSDHLRIHKPYIDAITYDSPKAVGKRMRRVPDVIDCWFDSGAMPFAQWGYPHQAGSAENFQGQFPADFISEAIDQTRGWFYSQLAISTLLFGEDQAAKDTPTFPYPHPFRNCIVLGLMLGEDGQKMSKSKRNYREPREIFDRYGADALRWFFFANQPPWTSIRYSEQAIKETIPEFLLKLWHVYSFFVIYANIDGFDPITTLPGAAGDLSPAILSKAKDYRPIQDRGELDRWILSELGRTCQAVVARMDQYDNFNACAQIIDFVDALSNWYVRRSRQRFWSNEKGDTPAGRDKRDAYWTLYECLLTASKLIAPFVPFLAETLWQNLAVAEFRSKPAAEQPLESVHLADYPLGDDLLVDNLLSAQMGLVREIVSLGRAARMGAKLKVRQPLARVEVVMADTTHLDWLEEHASLICDELNVKQVEFAERADHYITYTILPDLKRLGPRIGKQLPAVKKMLAEADGAALMRQLEVDGRVSLQLAGGAVHLDSDDLQIRLQAKPGWAAAQGKACVVVLSTELNDDLLREGIANELARAINDRRKEIHLEFTDRVKVGIVTESPEVRRAVEQYREFIMQETLAVSLELAPLVDVECIEVKIGDESAKLYVFKQPD
jgi:isoleucyl-tRNA synthetase